MDARLTTNTGVTEKEDGVHPHTPRPLPPDFTPDLELISLLSDADRFDSSHQGAMKALRQLCGEDIDILREVRIDRTILFLAPKIVEIIGKTE